MKLLSILLSAAFVVVINGQTDCDFDFVCDDTGSPGDLEMDAPSPLACYQACRKANDAQAGDCLFWTYYEELGYGRSFDEENDTELDGVDGKLRGRGRPVCRRLTSCHTTFDKSACGSTVFGSKCASGDVRCEECDKCGPLKYIEEVTRAHWTCDVDLPYRKALFAPDTKCRTECPSTAWDDNYAESTCESGCATGDSTGSWSPTGVTDGTDPVIPTLDSPCPCKEILLGKHQVSTSPNGETYENGARLFCNGLIDNGDGTQTMASTSTCKLQCNGHLKLDIQCSAGFWSNKAPTGSEVEDSEDIYCWGPPQACEFDVNNNMCECTGGGATTICAPGEFCKTDDGTCNTVCDQSSIAINDACFCKTGTGFDACQPGEICNNGACSGSTTPGQPTTTPP